MIKLQLRSKKMRKSLKRLAAVLLSVALCLGCTVYAVPFSVDGTGLGSLKANAGSAVLSSGDFYYSVNDDNTVTITGYKGEGGKVTVPSKIAGKKVAAIGEYTFADNETITKVSLPDGITKIGNYAFYFCRKLTSINIPNSVTSIGNSAFYNCSSLTSITIPNGVTSIGHNTFFHCSSLTSITIPNGVTDIGDYAFYACSSLTSINIPDSVISIGDDAFSNTAWYNEQPDGLVYAGKVAYKFKGGTPENQSIVLKKDTKRIEAYAFEYCYWLTSITIPDSVTSIGVRAFYNCPSLASINIPDSVTSIGRSAFDNTAWYNEQPDGLVYAGKVAYKYKGEMPENTSIVLREDTKGIAAYAFAACFSLTSVTIGNSVTSIGDSIFSGSSSLNSISVSSGNKTYHSNGNCLIETKSKTLIAGCKTSVIPADGSVTSIGDSAFPDCTSLTSINIPNSVTSIGDSAFYGCTSLSSVRISNSLTSIGDSAFHRCSSLTSISLPDSLTSIGESAFSYCTSLTSVDIPDSVTRIGESAFERCISLASVTLGSGVTSINNYVFYCCSSLTHINIPDNVTSIGVNAFCCCSSLISVLIGNGVTSIGWNAFALCENLTDVYYTGSKDDWKNIKIADNDCLLKATIHFITVINTSTVKEKNGSVYAAANLTAADVLSAAGEGAKILKTDGKELGNKEKVGSGMTLVKSDGTKETIIVKGDNTGDGEITASDARFALRTAVSLEKPNSWEKNASLVDNSKTNITAADARLILRAAVNLEKISIY